MKTSAEMVRSFGLSWLSTILFLILPFSATAADLLGGLFGKPEMSLSTTRVGFADQLVGSSSAAQYLTVRNSGNAPLEIRSVARSGSAAGDYRSAGCVTTLQPGAACKVELRFRPSVTGARDATLTLSGNVPSRSVSLSGKGVAPPPASGSGYRAQNGQIINGAGNPVQIRGINMYGFNADILIPQYLWQMNWKAQIQQVKSLGFNTIRVPFVPDTLYTPQAGYFDPNRNPELVGKTPLQILDLWLAEVDRQGLYFVLDFHSVAKNRQNNTWHTTATDTYNGQPYTEDHWVRDLVFVAKRYAHLRRFMGIDLYNEPTGEVRWGSGDANAYKPANDWKRAAERAGNAVLSANPKLLVFVEGISANWDGVESTNVPINYGENLRPQSYLPLNIPNAKLVFAPHSYGPDVYQKSTFSHPDFPANLAKDWELLFGQFHPRHPVVMGEFGGRYGNGSGGAKDKVWQDAFVDYLIGKNMRGGFYWCYTPNSWDTGGILDDNLQVRQDKMALMHRLWGR
jgi:endoglucanase